VSDNSSPINILGDAGLRLVRFAAWAALLVTALSFFGSWYWFLELFTHFRLQLAGAALSMAVLAMLFRMPRAGALFAALSVVNLSFLVPYLLPEFGTVQAKPASIRVMTFNLSARTGDSDALVNMIDSVQPDVIGLVEVQKRWGPSLKRLEATYPYQITRPEGSYFGLALLSRFPLRELEVSPYVHDGLQTAIVAELELWTVRTTLAVSHVMAPMSPERADMRNAQLEGLSAVLRDDGNRARILVGDLNITPWSPRYDVIESQTGLRNAARSLGYLGTWPASPALLRIPIDHCLVSDSFAVQHVEVGPDIGSDHLPLIVDISIAGPPDRRT
jgi:endonuclease/exonuclease/phosphatase (EEP) superfamily protein YafD